METLLDREDLVFNPPELGCVLYLPGLPGGGSKIYDRSPYGNQGTIVGATWVRLPSGLWILSFDGFDDNVDIAGLTDDLSSADFTAMCWIKTTDVGGYVLCQAHAVDPYASDWIFLQEGIFWMRSVTLGNIGDVCDDVWHKLAMVWDVSEETYEGFIDGVSIGTSAAVSGYGGVGSVKIGVKGDGAGVFCEGLFALFTIHRGLKLSVLEIQNHFNQEKHLFGVC